MVLTSNMKNGIISSEDDHKGNVMSQNVFYCLDESAFPQEPCDMKYYIEEYDKKKEEARGATISNIMDIIKNLFDSK